MIKLVAALKGIYRDPLTLRMEGMSYSQIAKLLDLPEGTARQRVSRARAILLKELMEDE